MENQENILQYPDISVVIITYRHEKFICQAIGSVLMQQYPGKVELIISNDHSPDATDSVVRMYLNSRQIPENFTLRYTAQPVNLGMLGNLSWALRQASGKYVALCEGDDYWTDPLKLQKQVYLMESQPDMALCFHPASRFYESDGHSEPAEPLEERYYTSEEILSHWIVLTPSVVFRNSFKDESLFLRLQNTNYIYADIIMHLSIAQHGRLYALSEDMCTYRIHDLGFMTLYAQDWEKNGWRFLNHHLAMSKDFGGKYRKINYRLVAEQYLRFFYHSQTVSDRFKFYKNYLQYQFKSGTINIGTLKTLLSASAAFIKKLLR